VCCNDEVMSLTCRLEVVNIICCLFPDDALGTSLDQRVSRFHQIQSVSVDNSLPRTPAAPTGMPRRASVLFLLLHGGFALLHTMIII